MLGPLAQGRRDVGQSGAQGGASAGRARSRYEGRQFLARQGIARQAAGIGGGSADAAAALRLLAQLNGLALDDPRIIEVARLTGADVPVCVNSRRLRHDRGRRNAGAALLTENALRDGQPRCSRRDQRRFKALGLRNGELQVGVTDVLLQDRWPDGKASLEDWVEALAASSNDLEAPAMRVEPVIAEVIAALNATNGAWLARMSGSGATCFAIYENTAEAGRAAEQDSGAITPDGGCMRGTLSFVSFVAS